MNKIYSNKKKDIDLDDVLFVCWISSDAINKLRLKTCQLCSHIFRREEKKEEFDFFFIIKSQIHQNKILLFNSICFVLSAPQSIKRRAKMLIHKVDFLYAINHTTHIATQLIKKLLNDLKLSVFFSKITSIITFFTTFFTSRFDYDETFFKKKKFSHVYSRNFAKKNISLFVINRHFCVCLYF